LDVIECREALTQVAQELAPMALSAWRGRKIVVRFVVGLTAEERAERWTVCEDLAHQLVPKTLKDASKFPEHSHDETLRRMRRAIEGKGWTERLETDWLMERLRGLLGW
jgi:hypothetical protein